MLATGEREAVSWRDNSLLSADVIRSTMLDKQSKLDRELLSAAQANGTRRKVVKKKKNYPPTQTGLLMLPFKLQVSTFDNVGQVITEGPM